MALPYEPRQVRGQPGKCEPGDAATPCRGRCLHRPGQPRAAANAPGGYGIRPYNGFSAGRASGLPMWPVVAGRRVGEGHAPPANPAPETRGFPGICGTYKMTVGRDALIPPHPAPPQTPEGGINPPPTTHGRERRCGQRAAAFFDSQKRPGHPLAGAFLWEGKPYKREKRKKGRDQRWMRPEPSPPASFSTSETVTML